MRQDIKDLIEEIKAAVQLTEAEEELLQDVLSDMVDLASQAIKGIDVSTELDILKATALNIGAAKKAIIQNRVEAFFVKIINTIVMAVLQR